MRKARPAGALSVAICGLLGLIGCSGSAGKPSKDEVIAPSVRPPYSGINIVLDTGGVQTAKQLTLDVGTSQFPKSYPLIVSNHQDNQAVSLWRYDFVEAAAPADPAQVFYATLLVRVDNGPSGYVNFFGRGGAWPVGAHTLNPNSLFSASATTPETPENKKGVSCFMFIRQGAPCRIVSPQALGRVGGYRNLSATTTVPIAVPGLDFPVGGVTLTTADGTVNTVGTPEAVTEIALGADGKPQDGISTPIQTVQAERVPTTDRVSPATSEWDLCFAWQPPTLGVTVTHGFYADPALAGTSYSSGNASATGGGFFLTMRPGVPSTSEGVNTLNWSFLRSATDSVWTLGWTADVAATKSVTLGQSSDVFATILPGQAQATAQVHAYLAGLMHPLAKATMYMGAQDWSFAVGPTMLFEGQHLPMVSRSPRAVLAGQMAQMVVAGRTVWYRQNATVSGGDVVNADQVLVNKYGTTISFGAYLPISAK